MKLLSIFWRDRRALWTAAMVTEDGRRKCFSSSDRKAVEQWAEEMQRTGRLSPEWELCKLKNAGARDPQPIPGWPGYWLTADDTVWTTKLNRIRPLKGMRGTFVLTSSRKSLSGTPQKFRWCVDHGIDPLKLSEAKLAVDTGTKELVDITDWCHRQIKLFHTQKAADYANMLKQTIAFCQHMLDYFAGKDDSLEEIGRILLGEKEGLTRWLMGTGHLRKAKAEWIADEVIADTIDRIISRSATIYSPSHYMRKAARGLHLRLKKISWTITEEDGEVKIYSRKGSGEE